MASRIDIRLAEPFVWACGSRSNFFPLRLNGAAVVFKGVPIKSGRPFLFLFASRESLPVIPSPCATYARMRAFPARGSMDQPDKASSSQPSGDSLVRGRAQSAPDVL